jgi:GntR family transcriptional regulator, transcriptional repressor for pyruvate dehydrogenase complex
VTATPGRGTLLGGATPGDLHRPIVPVNVTDQVVERLATAVALGMYVPGQRLPSERELAEMLSISRSTVREALQRLTESGYLAPRRGRNGGYFVLADWRSSSGELVRRHLTARWAEYEALFDARNLVEPLIAATAADRCNDDDRAAIAAGLEAYTVAEDREASRVADAQLHHAIAAATHNAMLIDFSLRMRASVSMNLGAEPYTPTVRDAAAIEHEQLAEAVIGGDGQRASTIAASHFRVTERLIRELRERVDAGQRESGQRESGQRGTDE